MSLTRKIPVREPSPGVSDNGQFETPLLMDTLEARHSYLPHLQLMWTQRRFLLRAGIYAALASILIALLIPVKYESVTRLMPPDNSSGSGLGLLASMIGGAGSSSSGGTGGAMGLGGLSGLAGDLLGLKNSSDLFVGILGSQSVEDALIQKFQLQKVYHDSKIEDARKDLSNRTDVTADRKSGIISITVTDHDPKRAAAMAQAYVAELDRLVALVSTSSARRERIFLEGRLQEVKVDMGVAAKKFSQFASENTAIDISAQAKAMVEAAAALQGQLIVAQSELSGLQQIYTNDNVRVRSADARVGELQKKLNEIGGEGTESQLSSDKSLYPSIRKLPLLGVTYADLYREAKIQETVYELLTQQYEIAKMQEAKEIPTVKVLDPALVPTKKSFPPRAVVVILGTLLGLTGAVTWLFAKTQWDGMEPLDPRKEFATEVFSTMQSRLAKFPHNGENGHANGNRPWFFGKKTQHASKEKGDPE